MSAAQYTPGPSRRVFQTAAHKTVICVRPRAVMPHAEWSACFERRALLQGHTSVIDGVVIEPGTPEARAAIAKATGQEGGAA